MSRQNSSQNLSKNESESVRKKGSTLRRLYLAAALLLFAALGTSLWAAAPLAKYVASTTGSDSARVAIFGHSESVVIPDDFVSALKPGDTRAVTLSVANFDGDRISEVTQRYFVEVITAGNLPLEFTLTNGSETMTPSDSQEAANTHVFESDAMVLTAGEARSDGYTLIVAWPEAKNDDELAGLPDYIQINLRVEQMD